MSEAIQKELARLLAKCEHVKSLEPIAIVADQVAAALPAMKMTVDIVEWVAYPPFVCIRVDVNSFDEAVPIFRELAKHGWHTYKPAPFEDYMAVSRRTYYLFANTPIEALDPRTECISNNTMEQQRRSMLRVMAFVNEGGLCEKVKVGETTEPVYEWKCGKQVATP